MLKSPKYYGQIAVHKHNFQIIQTIGDPFETTISIHEEKVRVALNDGWVIVSSHTLWNGTVMHTTHLQYSKITKWIDQE